MYHLDHHDNTYTHTHTPGSPLRKWGEKRETGNIMEKAADLWHFVINVRHSQISNKCHVINKLPGNSSTIDCFHGVWLHFQNLFLVQLCA